MENVLFELTELSKQCLSGDIRTSNLRYTHKQEIQKLMEYTKTLGDDMTLTNRMWHVLNGLNIPKCIVCNNNSNWDRHAKKYSEFCSRKCSGKEVIKRSRKTMLQRYGVEFTGQSSELMKKVKATNLERYGCEHGFANEEIKIKIKDTFKKKYGKDHPLQDLSIKEKLKQTNLKRWGTEYPLQSESGKALYREKTGHDFPLSDIKLREEINKKLLESFGGYYPSQIKNHDADTIDKVMNKDWLYEQHVALKKPLEQISRELNGYDPTSLSDWLSKHDIPLYRYHDSSEQKQIYDFLIANGIECIENDRTIIKPNEIDLFLPEYNIGIEYCGLFWHCELNKENNYHRTKYEKCKNSGVRLITIFSDEWLLKRDIVEKKLLHLLNKSKCSKIYARQTTVNAIDSETADNFYNFSHIQGTTPTKSINLALIDDSGNIVSAMSFSRTKQSYELVRYCTSCTVVGGFSKLLSYFKLNYEYDMIISFADLRWSDGDIYIRNGFIAEKTLPPDYYYIKKNKRFHKFGFRHSTLKNKFERYDSNLSEHQNCLNHGYYRIYDCGKIKFVLRRPCNLSANAIQ